MKCITDDMTSIFGNYDTHKAENFMVVFETCDKNKRTCKTEKEINDPVTTWGRCGKVSSSIAFQRFEPEQQQGGTCNMAQAMLWAVTQRAKSVARLAQTIEQQNAYRAGIKDSGL